MNNPIEPLEPRRHLAASPVDLTWNFSHDGVNTAAGQYVELENAIDAGRERTIVVGRVGDAQSGSIVLVALDINGKLDRTFSQDGLMGAGLPWLRQVPQVLATQEGYVYVGNGSGIVRLRGNGTRDRAFAGGRSLDLTSLGDNGRLLSMTANAVGGVDIVRTVSANASQALADFDGRVQLIRTTGDGVRGQATLIWERQFADDIVSPRVDEIAPSLTDAAVVPQHGGGWTVVTSRQRRAFYYPNTVDDPFSADVDICSITSDGAVSKRRTFNIGESSAIYNVRIHSRGLYVMFAYGNYGERLLGINAGHLRRTTLPAGPGTPGLPRNETFAVNGKPFVSNGGYTPGVTSLSLVKSNGVLDTRFADAGVWNFSDVPLGELFTFSIEYAKPGSALIGWTSADRSSGQRINVKSLYRVWTGQGPAADLVGTSVRDTRATITVRYSAPTGIAPATIGSHDLYVRSTRHGYQSIRLIDRVVEGDTVIARYRTDVLARGTYDIKLKANQIGTLADVVNPDYALLGYFTA